MKTGRTESQCKALIRWALLAVSMGACVESVRAEQFIRIETEIELVRHQPTTNGVEVRRRTYPATIITSTNRWSIETSFIENADELHYYDGTNVYRWLKVTKQMPPPQQSRGMPYRTAPSPEDEHIQVTINPGDHPLGNMGVNVPWLAYCSGNYLRREGRVVPRPGGQIRGWPEAMAYSDQTTAFEDALGLPRRVELYTSKDHLKSAYKNPVTRQPGMSWPGFDRHRDGTLVFTHNVEAVTNFLGFHIPIRFSMHQLRPGSGTNWVPNVAAFGKVISLSVVDAPSDAPYGGKKFTYVDYRFAHDEQPISGLIYSSSNYNVRLQDDTNLQNRFAAKVARVEARLQSERSKAGPVVLALILLCLVVPVFITAGMRMRRSKIRSDSPHI